MPLSFPPLSTRPLIVGTVTTPKGLALLASLVGNGIGADLAEVRVDALLKAGLTIDAIEPALRRRKLPVLLTCRIPAEGGVRAWKPGERTEAYAFLMHEAEAIDLELASRNELEGILEAAKVTGKTVILSAHSIPKPLTPALLRRWIAAFRKAKPTLAKIAARIESQADLALLARVLLEEKGRQPWAVMGVGPHGNLSREVLGSLGSKLLYGYLDRPAAPGQPSAKALAAFRKTLPA
ncbi:3-dehydroquinate dehydratase [Verrucomicrobium sp. GAS474]|uniref:type I 3-dehydroquinate dehydratase n=1 Tax=Verrucomicrobium sp. GAS474 TaxID=1882831 RepID=UPI00087B8E14|nr:type I 3-dehydroquinate dehydratase [Verrucomicrobium sp. GAS474]SDU24453.1 3-dehydroquinate dehydratase [Verrucomicrobium sp. GAS474]